ncbi:hypothetical protein C482_02896 [Natrialba chahannaoensis JCM 10990]|uniref:PPC domain-containing protein n=1 Tax=Natrialba chahannaoensis JCM 10990 TaxID=1227492 RepID=M0B3V0_9EURY|nr:DUF296 domain-containing protein [Natrialba chahannaoensis]ELZ04918.1 hypothetical protein C482_02896 [Natrialba chahannaoensis JCM 10990]
MKYAQTDDRIVVRLDPGEQVIASLKELRDEAGITSGFVRGIGAVDHVVLGHYDVENQSYNEETFTDQYEVTSFLGNIGPDKVHAHIQLGTESYDSIGGHCAEATVSGTFEIEILRGDTRLVHTHDPQTGLDVFDL